MGRGREERMKRRIPGGEKRTGASRRLSGSARGALWRRPGGGERDSGADDTRVNEAFSRRREGKAAVFSFARLIAFPSPEGREERCGCRGY